ncbi:MAG: HD domain-containing protein [Actinobacteria bacterium]|nr:HD domain-containing protein [Actinomycetota bacterium]MBU1944246.1 HD domain-containing protein [Actinomycetota bacterium]MBU2688013.1 HD domain-containing protein [Actinomycetota bacterium]
MPGLSLFRRGRWVEDLDEPVGSELMRLDYDAARRGFTRAIIFVYLAGLVAVLGVNVILAVMGRTTWWRFTLNLTSYIVFALIVAVIIHRLAVRTWLKGHVAGRVHTIAEITADAVYSAGSDTIITSWSKGAERMLGYTAEEIIGQTCAVILPEDFMDREVPMLSVLFEEGIVTGHRSFNVRKSGEVFPTEASITLLRDPDGSPGGFLTVLRDRSLQVQIEDELRRVRDEMETLKEVSARSGAEIGQAELMRSAAQATVSALAAVAERRDPYTAGHQQRVSVLATAIGEEMGLSASVVEGIRVAGILHDTGKVVIPGEILSKPTNLSEFEYGIIKSHPRVDAEIVEGIDFPWPVARAVLQHHERMDGTGYPAGLKADDIILEARVLAVADVVEAMASHRPYRPALGVEIALEEIAAGSGKRYDTTTADACLRLFREKGFTLSDTV